MYRIYEKFFAGKASDSDVNDYDFDDERSYAYDVAKLLRKMSICNDEAEAAEDLRRLSRLVYLGSVEITPQRHHAVTSAAREALAGRRSSSAVRLAAVQALATVAVASPVAMADSVVDNLVSMATIVPITTDDRMTSAWAIYALYCVLLGANRIPKSVKSSHFRRSLELARAAKWWSSFRGGNYATKLSEYLGWHHHPLQQDLDFDRQPTLESY